MNGCHDCAHSIPSKQPTTTVYCTNDRRTIPSIPTMMHDTVVVESGDICKMYEERCND